MGRMDSYSPAGLKDVRIDDGFWSKYIELVRKVVIPYQWEALNDKIPGAEPSYAMKNFRIAAGQEQGEFGGRVFQDSDVAKWLEAVAYSLETNPDPVLEGYADEAISYIEKAQRPDGYLNTYFTIKEPEKRWTNLKDLHELYCAGHMMEAAVAYFIATGKRKLLDVMCRYADYIDMVFGPVPGKLKGYPGHEELELALVKLYKITGNEKYLKLSEYFINERGTEPNYFELEWETRSKSSATPLPKPNLKYHQAHQPVREQSDATGHAVRAVYLYSGMADIAMQTGDSELLTACRRLWESISSRQMYITGGIGSTRTGEAFTFDYDLPNDTIYQETCATIGLAFFAHRMLQIEVKGSYGDVLERALYNSVISGMSQDGKSYFYVNPLEVQPEASEKDPNKLHVKPERQKWYGCACCPPNVARLLSSLGSYIYTYNKNTIIAHLYVGGEARFDIGGDTVKLTQRTNYPWDGKVSFKVSVPAAKEFSIGLRIPGWCKNASVEVNGVPVPVKEALVDGYAYLKRVWQDGDAIELSLDMQAELIQANPKVRADAGKVAIQRGPVVYCLEEADNGSNLSAIVIDPKEPLTLEFDRGLPGNAPVISGKAVRTDEPGWEKSLYRKYREYERAVEIKAIPYYLWGNRGLGEMSVWIRHKI